MQHTARRRGRRRECAQRSELGEGGGRLWLAWAWAWERALKMQAVAGRVGHGQRAAETASGRQGRGRGSVCMGAVAGRGLLGRAWHVWTESGWTLQGIAHLAESRGSAKTAAPKPQGQFTRLARPTQCHLPPGPGPRRVCQAFCLAQQPELASQAVGLLWACASWARCGRATPRTGPISARRLSPSDRSGLVPLSMQLPTPGACAMRERPPASHGQ